MAETQPETVEDPKRETLAEKVVLADGTVTYVDIHALGGEVQNMPKGYFMSLPFVGTVLVSGSISSP